MGGFLQSVLFGYSGLRLEQTALVFTVPPAMPNNATALLLRNIAYQGGTVTYRRTQSAITITLETARPQGALVVSVFSGVNFVLAETCLTRGCNLSCRLEGTTGGRLVVGFDNYTERKSLVFSGVTFACVSVRVEDASSMALSTVLVIPLSVSYYFTSSSVIYVFAISFRLSLFYYVSCSRSPFLSVRPFPALSK